HGYCDHRALYSFPTRRSSDLSSHVLILRWQNAATARRNAMAQCAPLDQAKASAKVNGSGTEIKQQDVSMTDPIDEENLKSEEIRSEEHTSELQSRENLVCRLL